MNFSRRTAWDLGESAFAAAVRLAGTEERDLLDLTISNPTRCDFVYETAALLGPLQNPAALRYEADPLGMPSARQAVAAYYAAHGADVSIDDLLLTTSTSEAYSFLFRLLCDAGDEVLIARPSYPLFDFLAGLEDVRLRSYPLFYDHGWYIDFAELERLINPHTRALIVVHPNNPTGHVTGAAERERLEAICARHSLALIVDEVFLDYPLEDGLPPTTFAGGRSPVLTFVLSGISKVAALPQMKVSWLAARGPVSCRRQAMQRLEIIADTFLSLNAPAQLSLPAWIAGRHGIQNQILQRTRGNLAILKTAGLDTLAADAGWSAILRLPQRREPRSIAEQLLAQGVIVHAGDLYGLVEIGRTVVSLLTPSDTFRAGVERLAEFAQC